MERKFLMTLSGTCVDGCNIKGNMPFTTDEKISLNLLKSVVERYCLESPIKVMPESLSIIALIPLEE